MLNTTFLLTTFDFSPIDQLLRKEQRILISSHSNPDGDAIGSSLALYHFLANKGIPSQIIVPDPIPDFLSWMKGKEDIIIYKGKESLAIKLFEEASLIFSLDYNSPSRIGDLTPLLKNASGQKILIDHHIDPDTEFFDRVYSTVNTSSTSELIFMLLNALDPHAIDQQVAESIYTGIVTDTGSFSYNCSYPATFEAMSVLISKGLDINKTNRKIYATNKESRLRLLGYSLSEKLSIIPEFKTAYIALTAKELEHYHYQVGDTEGLVNYALSIENIKFAALFTERKNKIRISFRSAGSFSVNDFAKKHFEGGGHKNASGGDSYIDMDATIQKFRRLLPLYPELKK